MAQKYKFFIKENAVTFSQGGDSGIENDKLTNKWIDKLNRLDLEQDEEVIVPNLNGFIAELFKRIQRIKAGGGFVVNSNAELLMIHRRGSWDLPKGKLEPNESIDEAAKREVEEECNISCLNILSKPYLTYHLYQEKNKTIIKESIWYAMYTNDTSKPVPQAEEDIERALWVKLPVPEEIRSEAYASIKEVISYFESSGFPLSISSDTSGG